jgi:hypothetical protein
MASAVAKSTVFSALWSGMRKEMVHASNSGEELINASLTFQDVVRDTFEELMQPEFIADFLATRISHPTDTHPQLATRLEALGVSSAVVRDLLSLPQVSAWSLVDNGEAMEQELTHLQLGLLLKAGEARLPVTQSNALPAQTGLQAFN